MYAYTVPPDPGIIFYSFFLICPKSQPQSLMLCWSCIEVIHRGRRNNWIIHLSHNIIIGTVTCKEQDMQSIHGLAGWWNFFKTPSYIQQLKNASSLADSVVCWLNRSHWTPRNMPTLQYTFTVKNGTFKYEKIEVFFE